MLCYIWKLLLQTCLLISSIVASCRSSMTSLGSIVRAVSLIPCGVCTCCCWLGRHFWHTHQTRENLSQTPLHTVSRKHVIQPEKRSKTLGTGCELDLAPVGRTSLNDSFSSLPHALTESSEAVNSDNIKSDEDVALDLQSIESKSAKACLLELYEDLLLDEHRVCCLLFHRYRPRYHWHYQFVVHVPYTLNTMYNLYIK